MSFYSRLPRPRPFRRLTAALTALITLTTGVLVGFVFSAPAANAVTQNGYVFNNAWTLTGPNIANQYSAATPAHNSATSVLPTRFGNVSMNAQFTLNPARNPGSTFLGAGTNQGAYGGQPGMFIGNPTPANVPALGLYTNGSAGCGGALGTAAHQNFNGQCNVGSLTLTFSEPMTDMVLDISGLGGFAFANMNADARGSFNSTVWDITSPGVSFSAPSGGSTNLLSPDGTTMRVIDRNTHNFCDATPVQNPTNPALRGPTTETAGCGSVTLEGTYTSVTFDIASMATPWSTFPAATHGTGTAYFRTAAPYADGINGLNLTRSEAAILGPPPPDLNNSDLQRISFRLPENGAIGDRVWDDANANGIQDAGEAGVAGVLATLTDVNGVTITDAGGAPITDTTDAAGVYNFTNLLLGDYRVRFTNLPVGRGFTVPNAGANDAADSDAGPTTGLSEVVSIDSVDPINNTVDAGLVRGALGDRVWRDDNADGIQDPGEPGLAGVTARLLNAAGAQIATTTTGPNGGYSFTNLLFGDYRVEFVAPNGTVFSPADQGGDDGIDSDADATTGRSPLVTLNSTNPTNFTLDAGVVPRGTIGNFVWNDTDRDGIQDGGETGVPGVTVNLLDGGGTQIATTTTGPAGGYSFTDLPLGDYRVEFVAPAGSELSPVDQGGNDTVDSDANLANGRSPLVALTGANPVDNTIDAGLMPVLGTIGDTVWRDDDGDGIQDAGEPGLPGVTVNLLDGDGTPALDDNGDPITTTTGPNGGYSFADLPLGDYRVEFVAPADTELSPADQGGDDANDSDADPADGRSPVVTLNSGNPTDLTIDAGITPLGTIGNFVWADTDRDGVQDPGEPGLVGVTVNLLDDAGNPVGTTTTGPNGAYEFADLPLGDYRVEFVAPADTELSPADAGGDDAADSDAGPNGRSPVVTLTGADPVNNTIDAGIMPILGTIGDTVWRDDNNDGIQDPGEPGVQGVTVNLLNAAGNPVLDDNGDPITTTTGPNGGYSFADLPLGDYRVEFIAPADTELSPADQGGNDATDSDADPANGRSPVVTLTGADPVDNTVDAGIVPLGTIGDRVWRDDNNDGIQDPGEPGYPGVVVNLLDAAGNPVLDDNGDPITTTTGPGGEYEFADLPLGDYRVEFVAPADTELSPADAGGDDAADSDAGPNGRSPVVTLTGADPVNNTVDAGIVPLGTIGDTVWTDTDRDGIQDPAEPGLVGVTVNLLDGAGNPVVDDNGDPITTTTGPNGGYSFTDLPLGDYRIEFIAPADTELSPADAGGNDANDSDANPANGRSPVVTLTGADPVDNTIDAGIMPILGTIGDFVWRDDDGDGIQDAGEPGIEGVTVRLLNDVGATLATTTTGPNGGYSFTDLPLGDYRIEFVAPADTVISPAGAGGDPANDSDPGANGRTPVITLTGANPVDNTVDAGIVPLGTIGDTVWTDTDRDGIQDPGEPGLVGVTVNLLDDAGNPVGTTTTGPNGAYEFADLPLGDYRVEFIAPADTELSPADAGGNDANDSDPGPNGRSPVVTLTGADPVDNTIDAGIMPILGTIGDFVWRDDNNDGIQDAGRARRPGRDRQPPQRRRQPRARRQRRPDHHHHRTERRLLLRRPPVG